LKLVFIFFILFSFCNTKKRDYLLLSSLIETKKEPVYLFSYPGRETPQNLKRNVLEYIINKINNSKFKIEIYAYSFNHPEILQALSEAKKRGVKISFLLDSRKDYKELLELGFSLRIWKNSGLHHIKAMVFDEKSLFLGTGNFSRYGLTHDWNGYIDIPLSASEYQEIIEQLETKKSYYLSFISKFQVLFSPENGKLIQNYIFETLEDSKFSIKILSFDHFDTILSHVLKQASARGVSLEIIQNRPLDEEGKYLAEEIFFSNSQVYFDGNTDRIFLEGKDFPEGGLLHHKTILVDDKILLTGSYNYSQSARDKNREIFLITNDKKAVEEFNLEFERIKQKSYPESMKFYNIENLSSLEISGSFPVFCQKNSIPVGIFEIGEGIFHSFLYFSKEYDCIDFHKKNNISSGYSAFVSSGKNEFPIIWNEYNFFPRYGNNKFFTKFFSKLETAYFFKLELIKKEPDTYTFKAKELEKFSHLFLVSNKTYKNISLDQGQFSIDDIKNLEEAILVSSFSREVWFTCIQKKETLSPRLSYLLGRLWLKTEAKKENSCYKF